MNWLPIITLVPAVLVCGGALVWLATDRVRWLREQRTLAQQHELERRETELFLWHRCPFIARTRSAPDPASTAHPNPNQDTRHGAVTARGQVVVGGIVGCECANDQGPTRTSCSRESEES